jgi:hypothetical protein
LHVDYWDRLGWKDRFASARFSERQRALATLSHSRIVYTPGVFLNLREFRSWDSPSQLRQAVQAVNAKPASADIRLELDPLAPATAQLPLDREWITKHLGVAAFVQDFGNGEILQATALPVCTQ